MISGENVFPIGDCVRLTRVDCILKRDEVLNV